MDEAGLKVKKESSFEILFIDSEVDKYETSSFFSNPENDKQFQNISKSVLPDKYDVENLLNSVEKSKLSFSASFQHLTSSVVELNGEEKVLEIDEFSNECPEDSICSIAAEEKSLCNYTGTAEPDQNGEKRYNLSPGIQNEESTQILSIERVPNFTGEESFCENYLMVSDNYSKDDTISDDSSIMSRVETKNNSDCCATLEDFRTVVSRHPARIPKIVVEQIYPINTEFTELCPILKPGLKAYKWIRGNKYLQNLVTDAKSSLHRFLSKFEMEINTMLGIETSIRILLISAMEESLPFKEALLESFNGQVIIGRCTEINDITSPVLPIGYDSALRTAQSLINNARQELDCSNYNVILSSTTFITENVPQRWQMCTALCLEDLDAGLNLHNFSATTPIPNEYICQAIRLTPKDYPLKEFGLAISLKEATANITQINSNDMQEFLSGVKNFETLKLTAKVLAGMYSKYIMKYPC